MRCLTATSFEVSLTRVGRENLSIATGGSDPAAVREENLISPYVAASESWWQLSTIDGPRESIGGFRPGLTHATVYVDVVTATNGDKIDQLEFFARSWRSPSSSQN